MRRAFLIIPLLVLAACEAGPGGAPFGLAGASPPRPAGIGDAELAAFRAAVVEAGCRVTNAEEAAVVEARTGLTEDQLRDVVEYLAGQGELVDARDTGFVLASGTCAEVASGAG
ncbi:hypothetical protein [Histidinibacterium lentulum]|uniref:NADH dehydrogenase n=1 Tax=Histidinibacterium lentulum TaxID=2480588 RepID=A0A3N2QTH6_9RHOB|nr:hypothetical protein [Histidinibacterium lentulum]ROT98526.1 hypothetical protein EAT49_16425 [Histidinibacterium lentulum]